jgi:superfamily II DNA or RNA helicase
MKMEVTTQLVLNDIPTPFREEVKSNLTFQNPKYLDNEKHGRWNGNTPRLIKCYQETPGDGLALPRGFIWAVFKMAVQHSIRPIYHRDQRRTLPQVDFIFNGELRPFQKLAVSDMQLEDNGTLCAATGAGKTVMALALIAKRRQPTLIVVHTKELLNQWISRIGSFLGIPRDEIGVIGGGKKRIGEKVTVALVQSLYKSAAEVCKHFGHIVVDECHRVPSRTFTEAITAFDAKYMTGLSATPYRRDRLTRLIFLYVGRIMHEVDKGELIYNGDILQPEIITRETEFTTCLDASLEYSSVLKELTVDEDRNRLIVADVAQEARNGNCACIVLSDRKKHCNALQEAIRITHGIEAEVLTGDTPEKQREEIVKKLNVGHLRVVIATGQLIGEGFDCKNLTTMFLATPVKFSGRILQYAGRILRPAPGKNKPRMYDYVDTDVPVLLASARSRQQVLNKQHNSR